MSRVDFPSPRASYSMRIKSAPKFHAFLYLPSSIAVSSTCLIEDTHPGLGADLTNPELSPHIHTWLDRYDAQILWLPVLHPMDNVDGGRCGFRLQRTTPASTASSKRPPGFLQLPQQRLRNLIRATKLSIFPTISGPDPTTRAYERASSALQLRQMGCGDLGCETMGWR